jgi:Do/DeqQ family serine protease
MKTRDRYLSGILLILIGVIIGTLFAFYQQQFAVNDQADVAVTEVKHSSKPLFSDEQLAKIDARFLFKQVAEHVTPTVVKIETVVPVSRSEIRGEEYGDRNDGFWGNIIPRRAHTVGSGILISSDGYILTNNHVIEGSVDNKIEVVLDDKRTFEARLVGHDSSTDLAVIKIDGRNLPAITIGNSDQVDVGEWVLAIGNPFRLKSTVTAGIVSALSRDVQIINDEMRIESFIQTDAAINKGNSGGALVNTSGELIGVNTAIASQSGSYQGYGFAVPSNLAAKVARDIIEFGEVRRALLGVQIVSVDAARAEDLNMNEIRGVQITDVNSGGAADQSGLYPKDVILSVNGEKVNESNQLQQKIAVLRPGESVDLEILRNGRKITKSVQLGMLERDEEQLAYSEIPYYEENYKEDYEDSDGGDNGPNMRGIEFEDFDLGFRVMALSKPNDIERYDLIITEVKRKSEAAKKGFKEGFRIKKVDDEKVESLESLRDLVNQILSEKNSITFEVETREGAVELFELER